MIEYVKRGDDVKFEINENYQKKLTKIEKIISRYDCLFEDGTQEFGFDFTDDLYSIWYKCQNITRNVSYSKDALKFCDVRSGGIIFVFKDKKYVFLPVTDNQKRNAFLQKLGEMMKSSYSAFKFSVSQRLALPGEDGKSKRVSYDFTDNPIVYLIMGIIAIIMGIVFMFMFDDYENVTRESCTDYEGRFEEYIDEGSRGISVILEDGEMQYIRACCCTPELKDKLEVLQKGEALTFIIEDASGYTLEISKGEETLLEFDDSLAEIKKETIGFGCIGIGVTCCAVFMIFYGMVRIVQEKKEKQ